KVEHHNVLDGRRPRTRRADHRQPEQPERGSAHERDHPQPGLEPPATRKHQCSLLPALPRGYTRKPTPGMARQLCHFCRIFTTPGAAAGRPGQVSHRNGEPPGYRSRYGRPAGLPYRAGLACPLRTLTLMSFAVEEIATAPEATTTGVLAVRMS